MGNADQHRRKLADIAKKKADLNKKASQAQSKKAKKEKEASDRARSADRAFSPTSVKSYRRQAESALKAALAESRKIADVSDKLAKLSADEHREKRALDAATAREQSKPSKRRSKSTTALEGPSERTSAGPSSSVSKTERLPPRRYMTQRPDCRLRSRAFENRRRNSCGFSTPRQARTATSV